MPVPSLPDTTDLMLLTAQKRPFTRNGWLFELKYDGFRALARVIRGRVELLSRNGRALLPQFPEIANLLALLPEGVFDAELVVTDGAGRPSFYALCARHRLSRPGYVAEAAARRPATLCVFDVLHLAGRDLRLWPLGERKAALTATVQRHPGITMVPGIEVRGEDLFAEVVRQNLEGIVGKRLDSSYLRGRSPHWVKIKHPGYRRLARA